MALRPEAGTAPERKIPKTPAPPALLSLRHAALSYGSRRVWQDLNLDIHPGEFIAVLGANGSGKSSLLKVLLGLVDPERGRVHRAIDRREVGYIPQQKSFPADTMLRARDLVGLGLDGNKWGFRLPFGQQKARIDTLLEHVGASDFAKVPLGQLSGGEQQRLRVAQALAGAPKVLLCDEPLLSLDLKHQNAVSALINRQREDRDTAVVFVTHEINPILPYVDKVLYLAGGRFSFGTPDEVMTSEVLSNLYQADIQVIREGDRLVIAGAPGHVHHDDVEEK